MNLKNHFLFLLAVVLVATSLSSCRKENFYNGSNPILSFSTDTLSFDTVFTQVGTITRYFRIENNTNKSVLLNRVSLQNKDGLGTFRINVDGDPGTEFTQIEVPAKDFIYVFAEATVDPNNETNPFVIQDELIYEYNGISQTSYLEAWGRNAVYHKGEIYRDSNITWTNVLPHVILRNDTFPGVGVDSFSVLNIAPGTEIYIAQGAGIFVDGELYIGNASSEDAVVFKSSRIEKPQYGNDFVDNPGLWQGIALFSGSKAAIYNTCINQAIWGIQARHYTEQISDMVNDNGRPDILLDKVQIKNSAINALIALNAKLVVTNSMFYNSGKAAVAIGLGGKAAFDNCTIYNNGVSGSEDAFCLQLSNFASTASGQGVSSLEQANFTNCIVYGSGEEQIKLANDPQADFNYSFKNCLAKTLLESEGGFTDCIFNQNPEFVSASENDFHLEDHSPCINAGFNNGILVDVFFNTRPNFDIGAVAY